MGRNLRKTTTAKSRKKKIAVCDCVRLLVHPTPTRLDSHRSAPKKLLQKTSSAFSPSSRIRSNFLASRAQQQKKNSQAAQKNIEIANNSKLLLHITTTMDWVCAYFFPSSRSLPQTIWFAVSLCSWQLVTEAAFWPRRVVGSSVRHFD